MTTSDKIRELLIWGFHKFHPFQPNFLLWSTNHEYALWILWEWFWFFCPFYVPCTLLVASRSVAFWLFIIELVSFVCCRLCTRPIPLHRLPAPGAFGYTALVRHAPACNRADGPPKAEILGYVLHQYRSCLVPTAQEKGYLPAILLGWPAGSTILHQLGLAAGRGGPQRGSRYPRPQCLYPSTASRQNPSPNAFFKNYSLHLWGLFRQRWTLQEENRGSQRWWLQAEIHLFWMRETICHILEPLQA